LLNRDRRSEPNTVQNVYPSTPNNTEVNKWQL